MSKLFLRCAAASFLNEWRLTMAGGDGHDGPTFPGNSRSCAIWCILRCLALVRPLVKRWWASSMVTNAFLFDYIKVTTTTWSSLWLIYLQHKLYEKWNWGNQDKVALVGTPAWLPCNVCDRRKWKWLTTEDEMHCKKSNWIKTPVSGFLTNTNGDSQVAIECKEQ